MSHTQVVRTTELGGKGAGEAAMPVGVCLHGQQNLGIGGNLAADELDVVAKCIQVDFNPVGPGNLVQVRRILQKLGLFVHVFNHDFLCLAIFLTVFSAHVGLFKLASVDDQHLQAVLDVCKTGVRVIVQTENLDMGATFLHGLGKATSGDVVGQAGEGLQDDVAVNAITGSTGAGQKPGATTHFSWRNNNLSIYKPFQHQHIAEIRQSLKQVQGYLDADIDFIPYRGDFARGIFCTAVIKTPAPVEDVIEAYKDFYKDAAFTHYSDKSIDLKQVVNTNKALVHVEKYGNKLLVTSAIDNLLKGAVGQAVQNMNIMFGIDETAGLKLKASAF